MIYPFFAKGGKMHQKSLVSTFQWHILPDGSEMAISNTFYESIKLTDPEHRKQPPLNLLRS